MWALEAKVFVDYDGLQKVERAEFQSTAGKVLVRIGAAGVSPLDNTIVLGRHPRARAPLVLGNDGVGVIEDAGASDVAVGSRAMFTAPYGVGEDGAWQERILVRPEHLALVPGAVDDAVAASLPVAYLRAHRALAQAGYKPGMTVLSTAIGGSVGNATYQLARAQGAGKVISTAGSKAKADQARQLGFEDVIDLTTESLVDGVNRITGGKGVDVVIDGVRAKITSEALGTLTLGGVLITLGYSAKRETTINVTDLIWKRARMEGFSLFAQSPAAIAAAWHDILPLIESEAIKPIVEKISPFAESAAALKHLIEDRPFGNLAG